jgi:sec-independent protein translocase protein TatC
MTIIEHLEELRYRLVVAVLAIALAAVGGWFLYGPVFNILKHGYCDFVTAHPQVSPIRGKCVLSYFKVTEPFLLKIKLVSFLGLVLALPIVLYQLWQFITPGLLPRERRFAFSFVVSALALFTLGGWFAILTLPKALAFLLGFAGTTGLVAVLSVSKYIGFVILLVLAFGASFEFPLVLIALTMVGVLSSQKLRQWRRPAIVFIAVFAAVITPSQDWFTMSAMMIPLLVFYELSILISRLLKK